MIKREKRVVEVEQEVATDVFCDRCGKLFGDFAKHTMKGGYFLPTFSWESAYSDSEYENIGIHLCDDCWNCFYESFVFDRIKHEDD